MTCLTSMIFATITLHGLDSPTRGGGHADSGYFSLQSVDSIDDMTGKGKGKDVVR